MLVCCGGVWQFVLGVFVLVEGVGVQFLVQFLQGVGNVFFYCFGGNVLVVGDLCIVYVVDLVEQVYFVVVFGQFEQCLL